MGRVMSGSSSNLFPDDDDGPEAVDAGHEPWRPVWEDADPESADSATDAPPWMPPSRAAAPARQAPPDRSALLAPLAAAEDALSRLDTGAAAASDAVREGLAARLAFAEAAGWLHVAAGRAWVDPRDLALAEAGLLGGFAAAALAGRAAAALPMTAGAFGAAGRASAALRDAADRLPDGDALGRALALARALRRLAATGWDPLASPATAAAALAALDPGRSASAAPMRLRPERFAAWRQATLGARDARVGAGGDEGALPPLLGAGLAGAAWLAAEALEDGEAPDAAQALLLAAAAARRRGRTRAVALPFWGTGPGGGGRPVDAAPLRDPAAWPAAFLGRVAAAARRGSEELARLRDVEAAAARLAVAETRRSLLPAAADAVLRAPALTARGLARRLDVTPQGAALLLKRLAAAGVVREATGRRSFRAFVV